MKKQSVAFDSSVDNPNKFTNHEQETIFNILTGKNKYKVSPLLPQHIEPDLIFKINLPKDRQVKRDEYMSLSTFVSNPSQNLVGAFQRAQKQIYVEMQRKKQNKDPANLKIRYQQSFITLDQPKNKLTKLVDQYGEEEQLNLECVNQNNGILDIFSLQLNTIVYLLQSVCGFVIKSFMLYDQQNIQDRQIYMFLSLDATDMLKIGSKYRIKKQIDYTFIDFFLNDPYSSDQRPIKLNSSFNTDYSMNSINKHINRYFAVPDSHNQNVQIIDQAHLLEHQEDNYDAYNEQIQELFRYIRHQKEDALTNNQKKYIFDYNRKKVNPGCEKYFARLKKRRQFFQLNKEIMAKYGYKVQQEPDVFKEFSLPSKSSKGSAFFQKLQGILLYKPMVVSPTGDLSLFLPMQKIKLSYLTLKNTFKLNFLKKMGIQIFCLGNNFQKFGNDDGQIKGGIDGSNLTEKWPMHGLFTKIKTIRNYLGDEVGYEIMTKSYIIGLLITVSVPYTVLYIIQKIFGQNVWVYTTQLQAIIYSVSCSIFLFYWKQAQDQYIDNFSDIVQSKVYLSHFRGPYLRNVVSDQVNQFQNIDSLSSYLINAVCMLIILTLLVAMGAIFYGCRCLLIGIYDSMSDAQFDYISIPHIIAYSIFFISSFVAQIFLTERIISLMVWLQNPPSDEDQKNWRDSLKFYYLIGIQLIAPFFLLILQPFSGNSCWSISCDTELTYYIYSRYIIILFVALIRLIYVLVFKYLRENLAELIKGKQVQKYTYRQKLSQLFQTSMKESQKQQHIQNKSMDLINILSFSIYNTTLPISPVISLLAIYIQYFHMRMALLYELKRPINRSQVIIRFSKYAKIILFIGIFINSWINFYSFDFVQKYLQAIIQNASTDMTQQGIFLLKFICTIIYALILIFLGWLGTNIAQSFSTNKLINRKNYKYREYLRTKRGLKQNFNKLEEILPIKSIFRTYNPKRMGHQILLDIVENNYREELEDQLESHRESEGNAQKSANGLLPEHG